MVLELEESRSVAAFYASQELLDESIENPNDVMKRVDAVTLSEIERVAKKYIKNDTLNLAVIGNFENGSRFEKLLKL